MHPLLHRSLRAAALLAGASLIACSDSTGPTIQEPAELSAVLNESSLGSLTATAGIGSAFLPVTAPLPSIAALTPSACSYDAASLSFVCATVSTGGLTVTRSYALLDASGQAQSQFSPTSTAAVRTMTHASGTVGTGRGSLTIDNRDEATVSGLLSGPHVLDGVSTSSMTGTLAVIGTEAQPMRTTSTTTIERLVLPARGKKYPESGTITSNVTSAFGTLPETKMRIVIRFTGSRCVTVSVSEEGLPGLNMTIDVENPSATGCKP